MSVLNLVNIQEKMTLTLRTSLLLLSIRPVAYLNNGPILGDTPPHGRTNTTTFFLKIIIYGDHTIIVEKKNPFGEL